VTNSVNAYSFHYLAIFSPVLFPLPHMMITWVVNATSFLHAVFSFVGQNLLAPNQRNFLHVNLW